MDSEQKPALMSQSDFARHRGKSRQYISKLAKAGALILRAGKVDVAASDLVLDDRPVDMEPAPSAASVPPRSPAGDGGQQPASFAQARTVEAVYRARLRKLEFEEKSGAVLPADRVKDKWHAMTRQMRDKLLALPAKIAPQLAAASAVAEVRDLLDAEIITILKDLQGEIRYGRL